MFYYFREWRQFFFQSEKDVWKKYLAKDWNINFTKKIDSGTFSKYR